MTVLAVQVGILAGVIIGPHNNPETVYTNLVRDHVDHARQQRDARRNASQ